MNKQKLKDKTKNKNQDVFQIIFGKVIKGNQIGRKLGFPTANLELINELEPHKISYKIKKGVYFGFVKIHKKLDQKQIYPQKIFPAIIHYGFRFTFNGKKETWEAHILDNFKQNLYEQFITLYIFEFFRPTKKFDNKEELKKQIHKDIKKAYKVKNKYASKVILDL